ncbi:MAG: hypothetical protein JJU28_04975 [Cyclobacteriaceae bacterium]|nr:hypothetical protein [Cyclobacteriaceae bacterium]
MKDFLLFFIYSFLLMASYLFPIVTSVAQNRSIEPRETQKYSDEDHLYSFYREQISRNAQIYNGSKYLVPFPAVKGNPFLIDSWEEASVWYNQQVYKGISILYDIYQDALVTEHFGSDGYYVQLKMVTEKIDAFFLQERLFKKILPGDTTNMKSGFYEVLYDGSSSVYVKRIKRRQVDQTTGRRHEYWEEVSRYYVQKNQDYHLVRTQAGFYKLFKDKARVLRNYARENALHFKKDRDAFVYQLASHYDQLNLKFQD